MAEQSERLDLIQRAARRLASGGQGLIATVDTKRDSGPGSGDFDLKSALAREQASPPARQAEGAATTGTREAESSPAASAAPPPRSEFETSRAGSAAPVRLNFSELRRRGMVTPDNMSSSIYFEFRAIKRSLLADARGQLANGFAKNLIMVTSALPGEGKTFTSTNLALALAAERDLHVLFVDADVIKPMAGAIFQPSDGKGLTDLLNGKCNDVGEIIHRCSDVPNLSVIFSGERDEHAPELISSRRAAALMQELSRRYSDRVIIFDTSPILASAEPANLALHMHQIVMVVAAGTSSRAQVKSALQNVAACPNISLVFNKAPKWHKVEGETYYYYGYGGSSGSGSGKAAAS